MSIGANLGVRAVKVMLIIGKMLDFDSAAADVGVTNCPVHTMAIKARWISFANLLYFNLSYPHPFEILFSCWH